MTEPRRVRTQAERDADDHTWRHTANGRPGYATWPHTQPGNPSWWLRSLPCGDVTVTLDNPTGRFTPVDGEQPAQPSGPIDLSWVTTEDIMRPSRRRWWHRYTRRAL